MTFFSSLHSNFHQQRYQKTMLYLSFPFVFECGYRSILPRVDIPRLCFWDVWGNNVLFGRLAAFIGEWCWMMQISLALQSICDGLEQSLPTNKKGLTFSKNAAFTLPAVCILAEILGTAGPVTKNNLWCIYEAITWTYMFTVASSTALYLYRLIDGNEDIKAVNKVRGGGAEERSDEITKNDVNRTRG